MQVKAERIICDLFSSYQKDPLMLPKHIQDGIDQKGLDRAICDYIAGMTDRFAIDEHQKIFDPAKRP
jgi:dGTPase